MSQDQAFASCFPNGGDQTTWSNIPTSTILVCKSKYWQNEKHKGLVKGLILKGALRPGYNCNPNNTILKKYKRKLTGGGYPGVCDPNNPNCYNECYDVTCCYVCIDFEFYLSLTCRKHNLQTFLSYKAVTTMWWPKVWQNCKTILNPIGLSLFRWIILLQLYLVVLPLWISQNS